jgi:hypothetical protein
MNEPATAFDLGQLREVDVKDMAIRFAFGAVLSVVAAIISSLGDATIGGLRRRTPAASAA